MSEQYDPIPETCEEALAKWDAGAPVFSVSMGGLGPAYEQCIQILAFEVLRDHLGDEIPEDETDESSSYWKSFGEQAVTRLDPGVGFSSAQVVAGKNLAANVLRRGYRKALQAVPDRLIQVQKRMPVAP